MEENIEENKPKYENIKTDENIIGKKFSKLNLIYMKNFNKGEDITTNNSNIKFNQLNTIDKYGLIYFYNEKGIYFVDNKNIKNFIINENGDIPYNDLFFLKCENIFKIFIYEKDDKIYLIICTKKIKEYCFMFYLNIENLIEVINKQEKIYNEKIIKELEEKEILFSKGYFTREIDELEKNIELNEEGIYEEIEKKKNPTAEEKEKNFIDEKNRILKERDELFRKRYEISDSYECEKILYLDENYEDVIILDYDNYIVRYNNGDIIFYKNYNRTRVLEKKALLMNYNKSTSIFLIASKDDIYIYKEKNNFQILELKKKIALKEIISSYEEKKIIYIENIYNFFIIYSIENKEEPENYDEIYFIQMNSDINEILKIYIEKEYFFPDEYELEGIAYNSQLKRCVFTLYDKDINVLIVFNKHLDLIDKYYTFMKVDDIYDLYYYELDDELKLNTRHKLNNEYLINPVIGCTLIKFKFDRYNRDYELIRNVKYLAPYLMLILGYEGGFKLNYVVNEVQEKDGEIQYKLKEQTDFFKKTDNISNKSLQIKINEEIAGVEKEKFLYDSKKKESLIEVLNRKKLNNRNIFLHELDFKIKDNLEKINKTAYYKKIKIELAELSKLSKNKIFEDTDKSISLLIKESKDLFENEEINQRFIIKNRELTEKNKNLEFHIKNNIYNIQEIKNKSKELQLSINSPINLILTHPKLKRLFQDDEIQSMINVFLKIKKSFNTLQNHTKLIDKILILNNNLKEKIENCKKNYISKKEYECLKRRKDFNEVKKNVQNSVFIMYMKTFNEFFYDLYQFKENEMKEELDNLNEIKGYYINNYIENDEKNNNKRRRFLLQEEDIDEDNNNNNIDNNNDIISHNSDNKSNNFYDERNQALILPNNDNLRIEREKNALVNKLFNMDLIKEKDNINKNKLKNILNTFEGRVSIYNELNDNEFCTDCDALFSEFLIDDEQKKLEENKLKIKKEENIKKKEEKIKYIEDSILKNKKEKEKIERELKQIEDEKNAEIIEKEKENKELKLLLNEMKTKFEKNKNEREKEKKKWEEEFAKNNKNNEEQKKILEDKKIMDERIKKFEKENEEYKKKLKEEENKRKELEEKNKKLEEEKLNINNNNNNNNANISNINIIQNNNKEMENKFVRNEAKEKKVNENNQEKKTDLFDNAAADLSVSLNQNTLFTSNKPKDNQDNKKENNIENIFTGNNNKKNNIFSTNLPNNGPGLFSNISKDNTNTTNNSVNKPQNNTIDNIFSKGVYSQKQNNNNIIQQNNQVQNTNQNQNQNSIFNNNNTNGNNNFNIQFGNLNLQNTSQSQNNNNNNNSNIGFGVHRGLGQFNEKSQNDNNKQISYSFNNTVNNQGNNISPFGNLGNTSTGGLFNNNNCNQSNNNNDNFFS